MSLSISSSTAEQKAIQTQHMVHITNYQGVFRQGEDEGSGSHRGSLNMDRWGEKGPLANLK